MSSNQKIYVAGHRGMVGSAILRQLQSAPCRSGALAANVLIRTIWGSGTPKREFLYVDDMAAASVFVMNLPKAVYDQHTQPMLSHINVGYGSDITIAQLAKAVSTAVGYQGNINFDPTQPDGSPLKLMDSTRLNALGWQAKVNLERGLTRAHQDFLTLQKPITPS